MSKCGSEVSPFKANDLCHPPAPVQQPSFPLPPTCQDYDEFGGVAVVHVVVCTADVGVHCLQGLHSNGLKVIAAAVVDQAYLAG